MTDRSALRRVVAGVLATASSGAALMGMAGTADASPVPSVPLTTATLCTQGGGQVVSSAPNVQRCSGGGDRGDFIISDQAADVLVHTVPRPPVQTPPLPG